MSPIHFRLITSIVALLTLAGAGAQTEMYGYRVWQEDLGQASDAGPVKFSAENPAEITMISNDGRSPRCYAGAYYNYHWYGQFCTAESQEAVDGWYRIDPADGSRTRLGDSGQQMLDLTWSYPEQTFYGLSTSGKRLLAVSLSGDITEKSFIKLDGEPLCLTALAANLKGTLYGIGDDGALYTVVSTTGKATKIGPTGVRTVRCNQSLAFDFANDVLYWSCTPTHTLYIVDTSTGAATAVGPTGTCGDRITALAIPYINVAAGAPDRVGDRSIESADHNVHLTWTLPQTDPSGGVMAAIRTVAIYRDNTVIATLAGTATQYTDTNVPTGHHNYRIRCSNVCGLGAFDTEDIKITIGPDVPGPVQNLQLTASGSTVTLSWLPPTEGRYGGEFDPDKLADYQIVRRSRAIVEMIPIDASLTEYSEELPYGEYTYSIQTFNASGEGEISYAPTVMVHPADWIIMHQGTAKVLPDVEYHFYDPNGPDFNYPDARIETLTLLPADANGYVALDFDSFHLEKDYDHLYVYDGLDTSAPLLGCLTGEINPLDCPSFKPSNTAGALTLHLATDLVENRSGWHAKVHYISMLGTDPELTGISGESYPKVGDAAEYVVTVTNRGRCEISGEDYLVRLFDDDERLLASASGTTLGPGEKAEIALTFTPEVIYQTPKITARVDCIADENAENNSCAMPVVVVDSEARIIRTATCDASLMVAPASLSTECSIVESIYPAAIFDVTRLNIKSIQFFYTSDEDIADVGVEVYVGETDLASLADGSISADELHLFYEGQAPIVRGSHTWSIPCQVPYPYSGRNLVVLVNKYGAGGSLGCVKFCGSYDNAPGSTRFDHGFTSPDLERFDPTAPFGYASSMLADMCIVFSGDGSGNAELPASDPYVRVEGRSAHISGLQPGAEITLHAIDGRILATAISAPDGTVTLSLPSAGIFIIKAISTTFKILTH